MSNPKASLAALTASGTPVGQYVVREITLGLSSVLETIKSPLETGVAPKVIKDMFSTLYALTHSTPHSEQILAKGVPAYNKAAAEWADTVPIGEAREMVTACWANIARVKAAAYTGTDDDEGNAPAATDG